MDRAYRHLAAIAMLLALVGAARADTRLAGAAGYEPALTPGFGGHGWVLIHYEVDGKLAHDGRFSLDYNTDTLRLTIDRVRFGNVELGAQLTGEALLANVLTDYYRDGVLDSTRAFYASYVDATVGAKVGLGPHFIEVTAGARKWIFDREGGTSPSLVLPPDSTMGELRLRYTFWHIAPDRSTWEPQRSVWRVRGIGLGVELSADVRSDASAWGARDATFAPQDVRNDPSRVSPGVSQWIRAGVQVHPRVRLQLREEGHFLFGADDVTRLRVGGMNPYNVPLAGAVWAAYVTSHVLQVEGSIHVRVKNEHEVGVLVDGVVLDDPRSPNDDTRVLAGIGAFADIRWKGFQIDARFGWSPTLQRGTLAGGYTLSLGFGWGK